MHFALLAGVEEVEPSKEQLSMGPEYRAGLFSLALIELHLFSLYFMVCFSMQIFLERRIK